MYIITKIEHSVLKSIHDHLVARGVDPVMTPVRTDQIQYRLDHGHIEVAINAMVVFKYVTLFGRHIALTEKGVEVLKYAQLFGSRGSNHKKDIPLPEKYPLKP